VNKLRLTRLGGDDSLATENLIKDLENQIRENDEVVEEEQLNINLINQQYEAAKNEVEEIGLKAIIKSNLSLEEKIEAIFKLKGFTVTAVIAGVSLFFTTLGLSISNALTPKSTPPGPSPPGPSPPEPSLPDKVKEGLKKFAEWLKELANKSAGALPGIIGSIVSFIFKAAGAAIGFLAQHLIILGIIIVSSIVYGLVEGVKTINKS
jgi:hypothetical protein